MSGASTHRLDEECLHCILLRDTEQFLARHPEYSAQALIDYCRLIGDLLGYSAYKNPATVPLIDAACGALAGHIEFFAREALLHWQDRDKPTH